MRNDPIVDEVRSIRDSYAKQFNYDLEAIFYDIKKQQTKSNFKYIKLPPKRSKQYEAVHFSKSTAI